MNNIKILNQNYATTRLCYKLLDDKYLDKNGKIKGEYKFKINNPKFKIQNSKLIGKPEDKFETMLFLPPGEGRKGEGGLRTKGYFKFSYKLVNSKELLVNSDMVDSNSWWIIGYDYKPIKQVTLPPIPNHQAPSTNPQSPITNHQSPATNPRPPITNHQSLITNNYPLITIITVVYNGEKYLEETIQSVINQTYPNVEYIIIDGGSTDGTLDIIKKYEDKIDYWVSEKDKNMYDAINKGISLSKGKLIASLNSDDRYKDFKVVEDINNFIKNNYKCDGIYGNVVKVYGNKYVEKKIFQVNFDILLCSEHSSFMPQPTLFLKRKVYFNERYNLNYNYASDYDFNLKIIKKYNICFFNRAITLFRQHEESITASGRLEIDRKKILQYYGLYDKSFIKRRVLFYFNWFRYKIRNFI